MKIDRSRLKKSTSEVPVECQALIDKLRGCQNKELLKELKTIDTWTFGKCELYHWIDILDISDTILEVAATRKGTSWVLACDLPENSEEKELLLWVLHFTTLLIEHSFSRHLYSSMEHLITLLSSCDMNVVLGVLNLLYMFSKRSNFITRLGNEKRQALINRLTYLAESWGGKENGFGLAECSQESPITAFPPSSTTLHFEFYPEGTDSKLGTPKGKGTPNQLVIIRIENIDKQKKTPSQIMDELLDQFKIPADRQMQLYTHIRLACSFSDWPLRLLSVQARLQALSVLVYSNALADNAHTLLYTGILEELVQLLELQYPYLMEIRAAALRTLTSIIHLDRNPHFPKKPGSRLNMIIDVTGANSYHGFLPALVRTCIATLTSSKKPRTSSDSQGPFPLPLATALFSFLYHLASYEAGGEALVSCGMMESLLRVINWPGKELEHITFVTRAVRVIDLITNIDMQAFQTHGGLSSFINRLEMEVNVCRKEQPFEIIVSTPFNDESILDEEDPGSGCSQGLDSSMGGNDDNSDDIYSDETIPFALHEDYANRPSTSRGRSTQTPPASPVSPYDRGETPESPPTRFDRGEMLDDSATSSEHDEVESPFNISLDRSSQFLSSPDHPNSGSSYVLTRSIGTLVSGVDTPESPSTTFDRGETVPSPVNQMPDYSASKTGKTCLPQRAALLKSMLNFLKKAIQDPAFSDSIRHVMEGSLPASLKHIISNAEYYGPSLFLLATDVVTVYVFQEPSLLSSLQDNGLTDVVLHALLVKDVPATREVLGSLPNVFSALCLNARGLASFVTCEPFERLFKVLLSPTYLAAMRRRRSSDPMGDTASNLGNAMDELMRHQPILKVDATTAIIKLLEELCVLGRDPKYVCWRAQKGVEAAPTLATGNTSSAPTDAGSSDEEDEDEEEASTSSHPQRDDTTSDSTGATNTESKTPIALIDYILNVMKFIDAILSNNSTDDHCKEFVRQQGLGPLLSILSLPNLPVDYPVTTAAQGVASVCKSILNLAHEPAVLNVGLNQLAKVLDSLQPLHTAIRDPGSSVLLHELATAPNLETAFSSHSATPLLHAMGAAHGYVVMFVHVCRTGQSEIRSLSLVNWGSPLGLLVLRNLAELYISLVWESTLLLALCSDDIIPQGCRFGSEDMDKLLPPEIRSEPEPSCGSSSGSDTASNGMTSAMEALSTDPPISMDVDDNTNADKSKDSRAVPTTVQLKYIKPLLGASSRLGRALAELFGLLVKLCVGSPIRARRGQVIPNQPTVPTPSARAVASALNDLLARGLTFDKLPDTSIPKFKLTFLICSVGFTSPMLFDEKKYPYHLMLQKFVQQEGQSTFYDCIRWALSADNSIDPDEAMEHPDLPDGTGEFLDASLLLLEKMVNPKAILDSPHTTSGPKSSTFDPLRYLLQAHQDAFDTIMLMWGKKPLKSYGARMSESMLAILRHILRGEKILMERLNKEMMTANDGPAPSTSSAIASSGPGSSASRRPPRDVPEVNADHLRQLMDMGFSIEHCREALINCSSLEAATDYLLITPATAVRGTQQNVSSMELDEEDQMSRAIAMSLGEKVTDKSNRDSPASPLSKADQVKEDWNTLTQFQSVIETFTETALSSCLALLDILPDTVYRICDLLITISKRNGEEWRDEMLNSLMSEISSKVDYLLDIIEKGTCIADVVNALTHFEVASKAAGRIHLFTLLFEGPVYMELRIPCAQVVQRSNITPSLVRLLTKAQGVLSASAETVTPKWLAPLLLLIDLLEKVSICTKRKEKMHQVTDRTWRWFDLTSGKWTTYTIINNKLINDAYWNGEQAIRINCGRRRYTLQFNAMIQTNEESTNRRPITLSLLDREVIDAKAEKQADDKKTDKMDVGDEQVDDLREKKLNMVIDGLSPDDARDIVEACVGLLRIPVDKDTLHAVMRVCLRLTRNYENAKVFAKLGGVKLLLDLSFYSSFSGFLALTTLIIRHVIEDPTTLRLSMEKVLRAKTVANIPPGYKELLYLLRNTSAAICRDPEVFLDVARKVLRIDCNLLVRRNDEEDSRLLLKTLPYRQTAGNVIQGEVATFAIFQLLEALVKSYPNREEEKEVEPTAAAATTTSASTASPLPNLSVAQNPITLMYGGRGIPINPNTGLPLRDNTSSGGLMLGSNSFRANAGNILSMTDDGVREYELERLRKAREEIINSTKGIEDEKRRPLLPKSALLKLLAEAVRSYAGIARLITDHVYRAGQSELVTETCTALAFVLDHLLPLGENLEDRECSTMARMLIAAIASCNHSPDAQTALVTEVRCALIRTLNLPESSEKHAQIQLLAGLVSTMVDNCPPTPNVPGAAAMKLHQYSNNMNNIVRIILRKGLLTDLARVSHHLDLSSPNMPASLNATLKPLETLSRIVNQPSTAPLVKAKPKTLNATSAPEDDRSGVGNSEATRIQDEEEHPDTSQLRIPRPIASALESSAREQGDAAALEDIMEQLLERVPEADVVAELEEAFGGVTAHMDVDEDHNVNPGNQTNPPFENDEDTGDLDQGEESDSDSETNASDDAGEVHDVGADDDDDEDDDDDGEDNEDEEENGSGYDEEELEFFESDEGLFRIPGLDRENEDILMIQYTDTAETAGMGSLVPWNTTFPLPFGIFEDPYNGNENSEIGNVTTSHPLLMARHQLESLTTTRSQRANRQRRYQYLQLNPRNTNPPVILQRLLGPAATQGMAGTAGQALASSFGDSRVVVMDNGLGIFTQNEEEQIDFVDQSGYLFGPSLAATLNNVPTALHWWTEEAKILDGESQPAAATGVASELLANLEKYRDSELTERKEKRKRVPDDEEPKCKREESDDRNVEKEAAMEIASANVSANSSNSSASIISGTPPVSRIIFESPSSSPVDDIVSRTESLAESIVETVLRPALPTMPRLTPLPLRTSPSSSSFSLRPSLLGSLSEILPNVHNARLQSLQQASVTPASEAPSSPDHTTPMTNMPTGDETNDSSIEEILIGSVERDVVEFTAGRDLPPVPPMIPIDGPVVEEVADEWVPTVQRTLSSRRRRTSIANRTRLQSNQPAATVNPEDERGEIGQNATESVSSRSLARQGEELRAHNELYRTILASSSGGGSSGPATINQVVIDPHARLSSMVHAARVPVTRGGPNPTPSVPTMTAAAVTGGAEGGSPVAGPSTGTAAEIPEGVDPSFLAALPEEMREEVIAEQLRLQRIRQRALVQAASDADPAPLTEVNPEFLAALPPSIQEEVLAQQRQEQQRQAAIAANPDDPVDTAAFFENLQPSLRQAILTDMEESQIAALPPDLAQEAQNLRREWETRNRQLMQERFFSHVSHNNTALSSILRNSGGGRVGTRYAIHTVPQRAQWGAAWNSRPDPLPALTGEGSNPQGTLRLRGRQLLDHEAMSCLLVLLFVDEPKLNTGRLHRVLRNLCYHGQTRDWVIRALISIMARCNDCRPPDVTPNRRRMATRSQNTEPGSLSHSPPSVNRSQSPSWLNISLDAALGCRANVFSIARHPGKRGATKGQDTINIHPQAAPIVFRHTLEVLISLAKSFPRYFLPHKKDVESSSGSAVTPTTKEGSDPKKASPSPSSRAGRSEHTDFWDMLVKLDSLTSKKGKSVARAHSSSSLGFDELGNPTNFETSAFGQLITMLSSPVVKRSCLLTDKLLRLLSLISIGLPDCHIYLTRKQSDNDSKKPDEQDDNVAVPEEHLRLAIQVLTSKSCSEEGLEDATALLLNLANCPEPTREMILHLLLQGALELSNMVNEHIKALLQELKAMNVKIKRDDHQDTSETLAIDRERPNRGLLNDRFTKDNVVVTAPSKLKGGCDLQLPSMATLTSKTSSQAFFLRILKVITQIRESIRLSQKNKKKPSVTSSANATLPSTSTPLAGASGMNRLHEELAAMGSNAPRYVPQAPRITLHSLNTPDSPVPQLSQAVMDTNDSLVDDNEDPLLSSEPSSPLESQEHDSTLTTEPGEITGPDDTSASKEDEDEEPSMLSLSEILSLDRLWETLSSCLLELADTPDHHAVLVLQPAVEAFFLFHASSSEESRSYDARDTSMDQAQVRQPFDFDGSDVAPVSPFEPDAEGGQGSSTPERRPSTLNINWEVSPSPVNLPPDQQKFLKFAETHRTVLNQILRQSTTHLADGPFSVLVDHTRVLDFDVKRRYFRSELERLDEGIRREELAVHVRRNNVFEDSFRELHRRTADEWKNRFYIVFEGEEGQDAGGLLREWYVIISREIFNPMYALFTTSPGDRVTYMINSTSHCNPNHLCYFKFVGRVIAKAIYDNKLLECYFTRSFYKHILGILVKYTDMETEDFSFYQGLVFLMENHVSTVGYELTFSTEVQEFGVTEVRDLIPNGRNVFVTQQTKMDYIRLVCQMKMTGAIRKQINAFLEGFYDIIPKRLIAIFNEQELELLISGLPNVDIEDLRANTEYHKYQPTSLQIQWFWRALRAFDQADRAKFLQFVTGTSKVPLQGFGALEGMNGVQKFQIHRDDRSTDRLPSAHTCFNQLDLPVYETYNKLNRYLQKAIHECSEGFGFA